MGRKRRKRRKQENWGRVWTEVVDYLVPLLKLKVTEQALYFYLMRHSHLKGTRLVTILKKTLGEGIQRSEFNLNAYLGQLARKGCVAFRGRESGGVVMEIFRPREIVRWLARGNNWEKVDVDAPLLTYKDPAKRRALLRRDRGRCFYCRKRLGIDQMHVDHLEPLSCGGSTRMDNCVASCQPCNREKGTAPASRYLYMLYRLRRLSREQHRQRVHVLRKLQLAAAEAM